jgi:ADP-ribose pyrophosphatase YjhB (NUDIX family)
MGGLVNDGETPLKAAKRELAEEGGLVAGEWIELGRFRTDVNRGLGFVTAYLACNCTRGRKLKSDDAESQELVRLDADAVMAALLGNQVKEAKWAATVSIGLMRWRAMQQQQQQQQQGAADGQQQQQQQQQEQQQEQQKKKGSSSSSKLFSSSSSSAAQLPSSSSSSSLSSAVTRPMAQLPAQASKRKSLH